MPTVLLSFAKTIAFDLTFLQIFQANLRVSISSGDGWFLVATL